MCRTSLTTVQGICDVLVQRGKYLNSASSHARVQTDPFWCKNKLITSKEQTLWDFVGQTEQLREQNRVRFRDALKCRAL